MLKFTVIFMFGVIIPIMASSVEIPLDRQSPQSGQAQGEGASLGYVDIEKVFSEHPMTKRLRDEFCVAADQKKLELTSKESEISVLEQIIISSTTIIERTKSDLVVLREITNKISGQVVQASSAAVLAVQTPPVPKKPDTLMIAEKEKAIVEMEKELESLKKKLETKRLEVLKLVNIQKESLTKTEEDQTNMVLADLYDVLGKIAEEEGVTIIVDKNQILYGKSVKDLTDKVLDRLRGR